MQSINEHATIAFSPQRDEVPGSYNMVEIRTGGNCLLRRFRDLCAELARGDRWSCDLIRELPADGLWVHAFRAYLVTAKGDEVLAIRASADLETAEVDWANTREGLGRSV